MRIHVVAIGDIAGTVLIVLCMSERVDLTVLHKGESKPTFQFIFFELNERKRAPQ